MQNPTIGTSSSTTSMNGGNSAASISNEEIYSLVKELLPQIEADIRREVEEQLRIEFDEKLIVLADEIENKAVSDVDAIFAEVYAETQQQFEHKHRELDEYESQLDAQFTALPATVRTVVESRLHLEFESRKQQLLATLVDEINSEGLNEEAEARIRQRLTEQSQEEIREELQRKEKALKVHHQKRLDAEKKSLIETYETAMKQRIDSEKRQLEKERSELARLKSLKNIKLNKIEEEKSKLKEQVAQQDAKYSLIVDALQAQLNELTAQLEKHKVVVHNPLYNQPAPAGGVTLQRTEPTSTASLKGILKNTKSPQSGGVGISIPAATNAVEDREFQEKYLGTAAGIQPNGVPQQTQLGAEQFVTRSNQNTERSEGNQSARNNTIRSSESESLPKSDLKSMVLQKLMQKRNS